jgi:hypothetical protein
MLKARAVDYFKVLQKKLPGGTEKDHENFNY